MSAAQYNQSIRDADAAFTRWCSDNGVPLHTIDHVITWQTWDDGIGVYLFLENISDVDALDREQSDQIKATYLEFLKEFDYPFDKFPNIGFEIDSDENVKKNYAGSYFNRLR